MAVFLAQVRLPLGKLFPIPYRIFIKQLAGLVFEERVIYQDRVNAVGFSIFFTIGIRLDKGHPFHPIHRVQAALDRFIPQAGDLVPLPALAGQGRFFIIKAPAVFRL